MPITDPLPTTRRALVVGASGGIGAALVARLGDDPRYAQVDGLHRGSAVPIDFEREETIAAAAAALAPRSPYHLIVNAAGVLHTPTSMPERRLDDLAYASLDQALRVNAMGPALLLRHFTPLLAREHAVMAFLSARVGSIGDNRLGGWYAYRASKAALNMIVRTAAIELRRTRPGAIVVALHPGTVDTALSRPFRGHARARPAGDAAADLLRVVDALRPDDSGTFIDHAGQAIPW